MSFVKRIVGPDEKLIGVCHVHWFYAAKGFFWFVALMSAALLLKSYVFIPLTLKSGLLVFSLFADYIFNICAVIGAIIFLIHIVVMISTEVGLTTKRVLFKTGLIATDVNEVDLEEIKAANVDNGWFGRFLNYGYLLFDARFVKNMTLPAIDRPYRFVKALNHLRTKLHEDSFTSDIDGGKHHSDTKERKLDDTSFDTMGSASDEVKNVGREASETSMRYLGKTEQPTSEPPAQRDSVNTEGERGNSRLTETKRKRLSGKVKGTFQMISNLRPQYKR